MARYFDTKSKQLGEEYRSWVFKNQNFITKMNVRGMSERFATEHHVTLPAFVDPNGSSGRQGEGRLRYWREGRHRSHPNHLRRGRLAANTLH